jgi:hypothetical protein
VLETTIPDLVVLMVTMRDVENRIWEEDEGALTPFDERFRDRLLEAYRDMAERLSHAGVPRIAWIVPPVPKAAFVGEQRMMLDRRRYEVQHDVIRQMAQEWPDLVRVIELDAWISSNDLSRDRGLRPDGLHWSPDGGRDLSARFLCPVLVSAALG